VAKDRKKGLNNSVKKGGQGRHNFRRIPSRVAERRQSSKKTISNIKSLAGDKREKR